MDSFITELALLVLAGFAGIYVIRRVPNTLHTPLMSATNAIHGIVLLGGLLAAPEVHGSFEAALDGIAIALGTINVVGGFLVTDRMLGMFKPKPTPTAAAQVAQDSTLSGKEGER
jgi:H+-translocating NAD(P) transhydrogenase subunit alpha